MFFDIDMIKVYYDVLLGKIVEVRKVLGCFLIFSEKIFYFYLYVEFLLKDFICGGDYVFFQFDWVVMQDVIV